MSSDPSSFFTDPPRIGLQYVQAKRRDRIWPWIRPGSPLFWILLIALTVGGTWLYLRLQIKFDARAFEVHAKNNLVSNPTLKNVVSFSQQADQPSLRHVARFKGNTEISFNGLYGPDPEMFRRIKLPLVSEINITYGKRLESWLGEIASTNTPFPNVQTIRWMRCEVSIATMEQLTRTNNGLVNLQNLTIDGVPITDADLKMLTRPTTGLKNLKQIWMANTNATAGGLIHFASKETGLTSLESLTLHGSSVTDDVIKAFAAPGSGLSKLKTLDIASSAVTDESLIALAKPDTGLRNLQSLSIRYSGITSKSVLQITGANSGLKSLKTLSLGSTPLTDEALMELVKPDNGLPMLEDIEFDWVKTSNYASMRALQLRTPLLLRNSPSTGTPAKK